jgi:hypothetical protein
VPLFKINLNKNMKTNKIFATALLGIALISSCKDKDPVKKALEIPTSYDGANFAANTTAQKALLDQLGALTDEAKKGRNAANTVTRQSLETLFTAGSPALSAEATLYYKGKLEGSGGWFDELAKASGTTWTPEAPNGSSQGGVYGGYLFDEFGVEMEQLVEKGQFNATFYNHATKLMSGEINLITVDRLLAIYGAKPAFANSGSNNVAVEVRDRAMANYGARRDKNDGNGMYSQMKTAFITLQAAVKAGEEYNEERDKALKDVQLLWEKINAATIINYCHSPISSLSQTNPTENQIGGALHAIGEGIGFAHGLKTINPKFRKITDAQIDEILVLLNAPANGAASVYKFATNSVDELPKLQQVISKLKSIYAFNDQEIEDFKSNWVTVQGR